jgi:hypothetical protein
MILVTVWLVLATIPNSYAQTTNYICLPDEEMSDVVVRIEKGAICENQVAVAEKQLEVLEKQLELERQKLQVMKEQLEISKQTIDTMRQIDKDKEAACDQRVKDAKPGFWTQVTQFGIFTAIGVVIGVLIM